MDLSNLDQVFSLEEIKQSISDLGPDKAQRAQWLSHFFFQKHWELLKDTLVSLCNDFYEGRTNLEHLNWIHISLIAKCNSPERVFDFRPISLINSSCKIISKILANRLDEVINSLVDDS